MGITTPIVVPNVVKEIPEMTGVRVTVNWTNRMGPSAAKRRP